MRSHATRTSRSLTSSLARQPSGTLRPESWRSTGQCDRKQGSSSQASAVQTQIRMHSCTISPASRPSYCRYQTQSGIPAELLAQEMGFSPMSGRSWASLAPLAACALLFAGACAYSPHVQQTTSRRVMHIFSGHAAKARFAAPAPAFCRILQNSVSTSARQPGTARSLPSSRSPL
jgi:hypothetical protein